ncbi:MAG: hypothetical protein KF859_02450 [Phycisphaeraceae bacterium]|nr:hypothetical protein [Phycisphaeraceae bacterium]
MITDDLSVGASPQRTRVACTAAAVCLSLVALAGCTVGGQRSSSAENDRLRREVIALKERVRLLEGRERELSVQLAQTTASLAAASPAEIIDATPVVTSIEIDSLSGFSPADPARPAESVVWYVRPLDGYGRFVQAVGAMAVEAIIVDSTVGSAASGTVIAARTLSPRELRDAYRSGLMGTHYTVEVPLGAPIARPPGASPTLLLRAQFTDALHGAVHTQERVVRPR